MKATYVGYVVDKDVISCKWNILWLLENVGLQNDAINSACTRHVKSVHEADRGFNKLRPKLPYGSMLKLWSKT